MHYDVYVKACQDADPPIEPHHWAMPRKLWKDKEARDAEEAKTAKTTQKTMKQAQLSFQPTNKPREFTRAAILHAVTVHIVCNNEVSIRMY